MPRHKDKIEWPNAQQSLEKVAFPPSHISGARNGSVYKKGPLPGNELAIPKSVITVFKTVSPSNVNNILAGLISQFTIPADCISPNDFNKLSTMVGNIFFIV